jgi:hypothetical protein
MLPGLSCLVRPGFLFSFYFWLDTVAVLSLAFELPALRAVLLLGATQVCVEEGGRGRVTVNVTLAAALASHRPGQTCRLGHTNTGVC